MYIARILYPVEVLGPGKRIGIWFDGCRHHCRGCSNPELWEQQERYRVSGENVLEMIRLIAGENPVEGFTLTGGDPFLQPEALAELLPALSQISGDILVYTGYLYEDLNTRFPQLLSEIAVLIDGPYVEARNRALPLIGSDNQRILFLKEEYRERYAPVLRQRTSRIQNFRVRDGVISVGIHRADYKEQLAESARRKGLEIEHE
ncbi:MAG: 4Fe-4S cluster-binding domain-containing protein [Clostridia bacterium]|nr:4Fe-4S cluster-binding domain-containing protein [Clostridia bacterium]